MRAGLVFLVACGGASQTPVSPTPPPSDAYTPVTACQPADFSQVLPSAQVYGVVCDDRDGRALPNVSVVATPDHIELTDAHGVFVFKGLPDSVNALTFYFDECEATLANIQLDHREVARPMATHCPPRPALTP